MALIQSSSGIQRWKCIHSSGVLECNLRYLYNHFMVLRPVTIMMSSTCCFKAGLNEPVCQLCFKSVAVKKRQNVDCQLLPGKDWMTLYPCVRCVICIKGQFVLTELKALVHLLLWLFCFLVWKSTTHHQIIGIIFLTMYRLNTYHDTGLGTYFFMTFQSQLTLPHCANRHHIYLHIHYLLTFLKWVATFNSQCRVFRLLHTSSGTANSSKRKWLLTTKHVSKLTHSLKTSL